MTAAEVDQYYAPVAEPDFSRTMAGVAREFDFEALKGRLDSIAVPTLVVWGSRDIWIPPGVGERMALSLPRAALVMVPGAGHDLPDEDPAALTRSLIAFLQQGLPRPPANVAMM
jgi:pimeloyl-ACP methyl ester carboxylesterase